MSKASIQRNYRNAHNFDEDFFCDNNSSKNLENDKISGDDQFLGRYLSDKKITILFLVIIFSLSILFARVFQLQILKGTYYSQLAEINRTREKPIISARGLIYDKNHKPLVKNLPIFDALIIPRDLSLDKEKRNLQIEGISNIISVSVADVSSILAEKPKNYKYFITIREDIVYEEAIQLKIAAQNMNGLYIETRNKREYLNEVEFSHILGYLGKITEEELNNRGNNDDYLLNDYLGKTGLELRYEEVLRGKYGLERVEVDAIG